MDIKKSELNILAIAETQESFRICTQCDRELPTSDFYPKGIGRRSSSCRACELARKKKQWLKKSKSRKRKKSVPKNKKAVDVTSYQISYVGTPSLKMVREYLEGLLNGTTEI